MRQYLNIQRMLEYLYTGHSSLLVGAGLTGEDVLVQTTVSHELRHFHDWLLSWTFLEASRRHLFLMANALETLPHVCGIEPDALFPVPVHDWLLLDHGSRTQKLQSIRNHLNNQALQVCELPLLTIDRLRDLRPDRDPILNGLIVCARASLSIYTLQQGHSPPGQLCSRDVFELSAIATQLLTIMDRFDVETSRDIYETCFRGTYYDRILDPLDELVSPGGLSAGVFGPDVLVLASAMALWSISASPHDLVEDPAAVKSCPGHRFTMLRTKLLQRRAELRRRLSGAASLIEYFDELCGVPPIQERVAAGTARFLAIADEYRVSVPSSALNNHPALIALRYFDELIHLRQELQSIALGTLDLHLRGWYEGPLAHSLTLPPIVVDLGDMPESEIGEDSIGQFLSGYVGQEVVFRLSDRINSLKSEIDFVMTVDRITSKIFFDRDLTRSAVCRNTLRREVGTLVGHNVFSLKFV